ANPFEQSVPLTASPLPSRAARTTFAGLPCKAASLRSHAGSSRVERMEFLLSTIFRTFESPDTLLAQRRRSKANCDPVPSQPSGPTRAPGLNCRTVRDDQCRTILLTADGSAAIKALLQSSLARVGASARRVLHTPGQRPAGVYRTAGKYRSDGRAASSRRDRIGRPVRATPRAGPPAARA